MIFHSFEFLVFLPLVFVLYYAFEKRVQWQNALVVASSMVFYGWWNWKLLSLILSVTAVSFVSGLLIERFSERRKTAKFICAVSVILILSTLGVFKYFNFFVDNFALLLERFGFYPDKVTLHLVLPVGISFYTFQTVAYIVDVYRKNITASRNIISFTAFISFFPQLVAGPIERAKDLLTQFGESRRFDAARATDGLRQMLWGFFKKIVVADTCAVLVNPVFSDYAYADGGTLVYAAILFTIQIYGDFSAYSDIAVGTAKLLGIRLSRNFDNPYFSSSIPEFWRRWHISLMSWFRDYVYIPLGGNRKGKFRQLLNVSIVFLTSGLWHGANWTFVAWGGYNGLLFLPSVMFNKSFAKVNAWTDNLKVLKVMKIIVTFALVVIGFTVFRSETIGDAVNYFARIFDCGLGEFFANPMTIFIYVAVMLGVEWYGRDYDYGFRIVGKVRSRFYRYAIYYVMIVFILQKACEDIQFIYFQF